MASFYHLMGVREDDFNLSHRFVISWLLPPTLLAILRGLVALYAFTTIFFILGWQGAHGLAEENEGELSYFTSLTFWGIAFYFTISAVHTALYARRGYAPLDRWPRPLQALHSLFYTTIVTFPFLVTIVFWVILYSGSWFSAEFDAWSNVRCSHSRLIEASLTQISGLPPRPQCSFRAHRTDSTCHESSALAPSPLSSHYPRTVSGTCLSYICDTRVLYVQLSESSDWAWTCCCLLFWDPVSRHRRVCCCLATYLGPEKIHSSWEEESGRYVRYEIWRS